MDRQIPRPAAGFAVKELYKPPLAIADWLYPLAATASIFRLILPDDASGDRLSLKQPLMDCFQGSLLLLASPGFQKVTALCGGFKLCGFRAIRGTITQFQLIAGQFVDAMALGSFQRAIEELKNDGFR